MRVCCLCGQWKSGLAHGVTSRLCVGTMFLASVAMLSGCGGGDDTASSPSPVRPSQPAAQAAPQEEQRAAVEPEANPQPDAQSELAVQPPSSPQPAAAQTDTQVVAPAGESPFEMSYLDPATELFVFARPAAIKDSPFVQALTGGNLGPLDDLQERFGIGIAQIESVTIGVSQLQQIAEQTAAQMVSTHEQLGATQMPAGPAIPPMMPALSGMAEHSIIVVRTAEPLSIEDLSLPEGEGFTKTHESKTYHQLAVANEFAPHLYAADETTFVVATEPVIQALIDQGDEPSQATADLSFIPTASHVVVAVVPQDREAFFAQFQPIEQEPEPSATSTPQGQLSLGANDRDDRRSRKKNKKGKEADEEDEAAQLREPESEKTEPVVESNWRKLVETHAKGFVLWGDMDAGVHLNLSADCDVPASALRIQKELDIVVAQGKQMFGLIQSTLPGLIQEIAQSMVDSLATTSDGTLVSVSATLPESQQTNVTMLPMVVMGMMLKSQAGNVEVMQEMVDWQERAQQVLDEGQLSTLTEEGPAGLQIRGLARWSLPQPGREFAPPLLELAIVATSGPAVHAAAFGQLKVTEAKVAEGASLKWLGASRNGQSETPLHGLVSINRTDGFSPHPANGVAMGATFHPPGDDVRSLQLIAGEVVLEAPASSREVTVSNATSIPVSIEDPALQSANFTVTAETNDGQVEMQCTYDQYVFVDQIDVLDASGNLVEATTEEEIITDHQILKTWQLPKGTSQPLSLVVTVLEDVQEVTVPFRFENLSIPEPPDRFSGQPPLRSWTDANADPDMPDGLALEGQARWKTPFTPAMESSDLADPTSPGQTPSDASPTKIDLSGSGLGFGRGREEDEEDRRAEGNGNGNSRKRPKGRKRKGKFEDDDRGGRGSREREEDDEDAEPEEVISKAEAQAVDSSDTLSDRLQFVVDLTGPMIESTVVIGKLQVESATANGGVDLEYEVGQFGQLDVTEDLADVEWDRLPQTDQPPNGLRVIYKFARPESPINTVTEFKGTLQIRTVRERIEAVVPNLNDRTDKRIKDRNLTKYGIEIAVAIKRDQLKFRALKGDEKRLDKIYPVDDSGTRIDGVTYSTTTDNGNRVHVFEFPGDVPDRVGLKFVLNLGVEEVNVPVQFSEVPVPPAPPR